MSDVIFQSFLARQHEDALRLSQESDLVDIMPGPGPDKFFVRFCCRGLVRDADGSILEAEEFAVGVWFPEDYLRAANPFQVLTWIGPRNIWHPNISDRAPAICVGRLAPGTGLEDLVYQCWEIITWNKVTMREDDALNSAACEWARANADRRPIDRRPLKRRPLNLRVQDISAGAADAPAS